MRGKFFFWVTKDCKFEERSAKCSKKEMKSDLGRGKVNPRAFPWVFPCALVYSFCISLCSSNVNHEHYG